MGILVVTISSNYDQKNRFIEIIFDASPDVQDYQKHFPEIARIMDQENVSNFLVHTDFAKRTNDKKGFEFTKFVFADFGLGPRREIRPEPKDGSQMAEANVDRRRTDGSEITAFNRAFA